jgi:heme-degrading monooxygenase HmoA
VRSGLEIDGRIRLPTTRSGHDALGIALWYRCKHPLRGTIVPAGGCQEDAMSIIRLIHIKIDPSETETAERIWKTKCASLMISQKGCISEKLLRARDRGEFISYSEWETEADIERYKNSAAHKEIVSHTRAVKGASALVKLYDLVN